MGELRPRGSAALRLLTFLAGGLAVAALFGLVLRNPEAPVLPPELGVRPIEAPEPGGGNGAKAGEGPPPGKRQSSRGAGARKDKTKRSALRPKADRDRSSRNGRARTRLGGRKRPVGLDLGEGRRASRGQRGAAGRQQGGENREAEATLVAMPPPHPPAEVPVSQPVAPPPPPPPSPFLTPGEALAIAGRSGAATPGQAEFGP